MKPPSFFAHKDDPERWSLQNTSAAFSVGLAILTTVGYGISAFFMSGRTPIGFWQWLVGVAFFLSLAAFLKAGLGDTGFKEMLEIIKGVVT